MRYLIWLGLLVFLGAGGYYIYSLPQVRSLFESPERQGDPLEFLKRGPDLKPTEPPAEPARPAAPDSPPRRETASETQPVPQEPQTPNPVVSRVLLQILAARGLADGLSLIVTDDRVAIVGRVTSEEARREVLEVVESGRGARRIDAEKLLVEP